MQETLLPSLLSILWPLLQVGLKFTLGPGYIVMHDSC